MPSYLNEFTARSIDPDTGNYLFSTESQQITKPFVELRGILQGIAIDKKLKPEESTGLRGWSFDYGNSTLPQIKEARLVIRDVLSDEIIDEEEFSYLMAVCDKNINDDAYIKRSMLDLELIGVIKGIIADNIVELNEISGLMKWIESLPIEDQTSLKVVHSTLAQILEDGHVDENEIKQLEELFNRILDPVVKNDIIVDFNETSFALSGNFNYGSKEDVQDVIRDNGGVIRDSVSKKCDYVVVGGKGSKDYAFGSYGTKIRKAIILQQQGHHIQVIHEDCLKL